MRIRSTLTVLLLSCLGASLAPAQQRAPVTLSDNELVAQVVAAATELGKLDAKAEADRQAFQSNAADLRVSLSRLQEPLPERPQSLRDASYEESEVIAAHIEQVVAFKKTWTQRQNRRARAHDTQSALDGLSQDLRDTHETLFDRAVELRALFVEAQRRIKRGDLRVKQFELPEGSRGIAEWVTRTEELAGERAEVTREVEQAIARLAIDTEALAALPPEDPELGKYVAGVEAALGAIAEAKALGQDVQAQLEKGQPETIPAEVGRVSQEWVARRAAMQDASKKAVERIAALNRTLAELEALQPARREDLPEGEGLPEIRKARKDVAYAEAMIEFSTEYSKLLDRSDVERSAALVAIDKALERHDSFVRQCTRAFHTLRHAVGLAEKGALGGWQEPEDVNRDRLWQEWKQALADEFERRWLAETLRTDLVDTSDLERVRAQIVKHGTNRERAAARLQIELALAASVELLRERTDDELLAMLAPGGVVTAELAGLEKEMTDARAKRDAVVAATKGTASEVEDIENPYTAAILRRRTERLVEVRSALGDLPEGGVPVDGNSKLQPAPDDADAILIQDDFREDSALTVAEVAKLERGYLGRSQQSNRVFLDYFSVLEASLAAMRQHDVDVAAAETAYEDSIQRLIQTEKRRYAVAREIRRRTDFGQFDVVRVPADLGSLLARDGILRAEAKLSNTRRRGARLRQAMDHEIRRLEVLMLASPLFRARAKAATSRVRLIGNPVTYLGSALTAPDDLPEIEKKKLDYDAQRLESQASEFTDGIFRRFTGEADRVRFDDSLRTFYLEIANTDRVIADMDLAMHAYREIIEVCRTEREDLAPAREVVGKVTELRVADYHAARSVAGVAAHPRTRARIEERHRDQFGEPLPYRVSFREGDLDQAAELLFTSEARLVGQRLLSSHVEGLLSKVGIDREIGWYNAQIARISSLREAAIGRQAELKQRVTDLSAAYRKVIRNNAIRGLGVVLVIPVIAFLVVRLLRRVARILESRVVGHSGEPKSDRQRRLQTLSSTSTAAISVLVWMVALIYIFARLGLDITPIVASASVVGLAVAFGAQALIKDFFYGFFILIENQFTIGDIVTLGTITGTVEKISLRITVLRDLEGVVHYIPNGTIGQVSNKTQGWSRVVMEVSVAPDEDVDRASKVLGEVLVEMWQDEAWKRDVIEEPIVAGVENMTESSVDIRVMIKTRPGEQWAVAREARRRIKLRFRELGIHIPFPYRMVHHVYKDGDGEEVALDEDRSRRLGKPADA